LIRVKLAASQQGLSSVELVNMTEPQKQLQPIEYHYLMDDALRRYRKFYDYVTEMKDIEKVPQRQAASCANLMSLQEIAPHYINRNCSRSRCYIIL
jgi:hypothetical protein